LENFYYSKKLDQYFSKRLDFLIYAHDGHGLGHASRGIAIGMALRRVYKNHKTLFISGTKQSLALIGGAPLDWIKLPAYETIIKEGRAEGSDGPSNFYKSVLGQLRTHLLASIIRIFKPRCVLVDHTPAGKKEELIRALEETKGENTCWVLGLRGVIGDDGDIWSEHAIRIFKKYYHSILWYGDSHALGKDHVHGIEHHFGVKPVETGYVSRLNEIKYLKLRENHPIAGTIAVPWGSDTTWKFLEKIHSALTDIGDGYGRWHLYTAPEKKDAIQNRFKDLPFCGVEEVGEKYITSILNSKVAMLYAGYNSLTDILTAQIPSVVILRDVEDIEQDEHLRRLAARLNGSIQILSESSADGSAIGAALEKMLQQRVWHDPSLNLSGAENTASFLAKHCLKEEG